MSRTSFLNTFVCTATLFGCVSIASAISTGPADRGVTLDQDFERFIIEKRALTKRLAEKHEISVPPIVWDFFNAAQKGDWQTTSNQFFKIAAGTGRQGSDSWMPRALWAPIHDVFGSYEQIRLCDPKLLHRFGDKIITRIPKGSIYFGGTDAGRFVVSALSASHSEGRPFYTLTQNALADGSYLDYLRDMYGAKIYVPTTQDSQGAFEDYLRDAQKRMEKKQLKEGESWEIMDGRMQATGVAAVMAINEILTKLIIDKNPSREIYLEESYALESLYGQSLPHGLIFKVNHKPLEQLPRPVVEADHQFWTDECRALIGNVVQDGTSVAELCAWTERVFLHPESSGFKGNPAYLKETQTPQNYSQCRSAIAAYYEWWSKKSEKSESAGLTKEADFAFRQAVAMAPYNPAVVWRYVDYLVENQRTNDAQVLIETTLKINPEKRMDLDSEQLKNAMKKLRNDIFRRAEKGDVAAQFKLGQEYVVGEVRPTNYTEAANWMRKAADQGYAPAQSELGMLILLGRVDSSDKIEGVQWLRKSADQQYSGAEFALGILYASGRIVPKDEALAGQWVLKAAEHGDIPAQHAAGNIFSLGTNGVAQDYEQAAKWYRKAAELGYSSSQTELGSRYVVGLGVPKDFKEAYHWIGKAAEQGNSLAQFYYGWMYARGKGVAPDAAKAAEWYRKAAEQNLAYAQFALGMAYARGDGVGRNDAASLEWLRRAAINGEPCAQFTLGGSYAEGEGVEKDLVEAVALLSSSAKTLGRESQAGGVMEKFLDELFESRGLKRDAIEKAALEAVEKYKKQLTPEQVAAAQKRIDAFAAAKNQP